MRSTDLSIWTSIWTTNIPVGGVFMLTDTTPRSQQRFTGCNSILKIAAALTRHHQGRLASSASLPEALFQSQGTWDIIDQFLVEDCC